MKYQAQAPLRIDFGGGWTDVPAFAEADDEGGAVLNAAISVYAKGYVIRPYSALLPVTPALPWGEAHTSTHSPMARLASKIGRGAHNVVHYELNAPAGAGLGGSAAQTLLWLTLVKTVIANVSDRKELAERAWRIENELGLIGGKQDQYCSALGGINYMTFGKETSVEALRPGLGLIDQLEGRLSIFYTGQSHLSGDIHEAVWSRYRAGDEAVVAALRELRRIAGDQREALMNGDLDRLGALLNENWTAQKQLHPSVTTERLDSLVGTALANGAIGAKATGAGGGGCLLCLAEAGAGGGLVEGMRDAGASLIPFRFDWYGVHLTKG